MARATSTIEPPRRLTAATPIDADGGPVEPRRARPVLWWAGLGAVALAVQAGVYGSWIISGDAHSISVGHAHIPQHIKVWAWIFQIAFCAGAVAALLFVVRRCRAQRALTLEAKILLAWWAVMWLDPSANFFRTQYFFNSYYLNLGSWGPHIPGWVSRGGGDLPFSLINLSSYTASVLGSVGVANLMGAVKRRHPRIGTVGLVLIAWAVLSVAVFVVEDVLIRAGWLFWNGIPSVTLWSGTARAIPLTEVIGWGAVQAALATLLFLRNDRGNLVVERGIDRVRTTRWRRTALSTLAVIGFATVPQAAYGVISAWVGFYDGRQASIPSYTRNGVCGPGTPYLCPGPRVPVLLPDTPLHATAAQHGS